jgi:hypothetical protein
MDTPNQPLSPEARPGGEVLPNVAPEEAGTAAPASEAGKQASQNMPVTPLPSSPASGQPAGGGQPTLVGPPIADDVDVIEKEWVNAAESVVKLTKDDPYREEEAVEDLQIDYLKKRYGKDVAKSENESS